MIQTPYIKINKHGIDLLKNFQTNIHLDYQEISQIEIKKGFLLKSWTFSLIIGLLLMCISLIWCINSIQQFDSESLHSTSVRLYLLLHIIPWILLLGGLFLIYQSLRKSVVIVIYTKSKEYKIALKELEKGNKTLELIQFLSEKVKVINFIKNELEHA